MAVARYTLAVNRRYKRDGEQEADFISCVTFGKSADSSGTQIRMDSWKHQMVRFHLINQD